MVINNSMRMSIACKFAWTGRLRERLGMRYNARIYLNHWAGLVINQKDSLEERRSPAATIRLEVSSEFSLKS